MAAPAAAQDQPKQRPLFDNSHTLKVRLEAPLRTIRRDREEETQDGLFHYIVEGGVEQTLNVKVGPRGRYRRQKDVCDFPPLRLDFRKGQVKGTEFRGQNKLQLVTHCESDRSSYEQNVLQEYVAYRILNLMTDRSFRVRLLHVDYIDSEDGKPFRSKYAFLIEDEGELGKRIGMQAAEVKQVTYSQLDPPQTVMFGVFQYLIGNTDFSAIRGPSDTWCCHNAIPYIGTDGRFVPIPYDFDFSGLVNAPYAAPRPGLGLDDVRDRQYRGLCSTNILLPDTLALFVGKRAEIDELVYSVEGMSKGTQRSTLRYVGKFYDEISNPKKVEKNFVKECLQESAPPAAE
jgi:hypothetical protein